MKTSNLLLIGGAALALLALSRKSTATPVSAPVESSGYDVSPVNVGTPTQRIEVTPYIVPIGESVNEPGATHAISILPGITTPMSEAFYQKLIQSNDPRVMHLLR